MEKKVEPQEGQAWLHNSYGTLMRVTKVETSSVVIESDDGRLKNRMLKEQLWEHFTYAGE